MAYGVLSPHLTFWYSFEANEMELAKMDGEERKHDIAQTLVSSLLALPPRLLADRNLA